LKTIAIVGANGGIGAALVRLCAQRWPDATIHATCRQDKRRLQLDAKARWYPLNLVDDNSIAEFVHALGDNTDSLDCLFICSGWLHDQDHLPEKSVRDLNATAFEKALRINATAPLLLMGALSELLTRPPGSDKDRAKVMALSAKVGSISDNALGGWHAYRMSKAALNMGIRNLGIEFARNKRKPIVCAVHPGTTHSALSAPFAKRGLAVVEADTTAERLGDLTQALSDRHQGGFFHWDGSPIPW